MDKKGNPLFTLDMFRRGQAPFVTIAGDPRIPYGTPASSPQFPGVPFMVNDTGSAFKDAGLSHFDIARDTAEGANSDENNRNVQFDIADPNFALAQQSSPVPSSLPQQEPQLQTATGIDIGVTPPPRQEVVQAVDPAFTHPPSQTFLGTLKQSFQDIIPALQQHADVTPISPDTVSKLLQKSPAAQLARAVAGTTNDEATVEQVIKGSSDAIAQTVSDLGKPQNMLTLGAMAGAPALISKAVSLGFSAMSAYQMYQKSRELATTDTSPQQKAKLMTGIILDGR